MGYLFINVWDFDILSSSLQTAITPFPFCSVSRTFFKFSPLKKRDNFGILLEVDPEVGASSGVKVVSGVGAPSEVEVVSGVGASSEVEVVPKVEVSSEVETPSVVQLSLLLQG